MLDTYVEDLLEGNIKRKFYGNKLHTALETNFTKKRD